MNLQDVDRDLRRRLIDFASGLSYGLQGRMDRVADGVYLLSPANVEVSDDERRRLQERGLPVVYPGLESHPDHGLLQQLCNQEYGAGGIFSLDLGDAEHADHFMEHLQNKERFGFMAVSLGFFDTLMSCSASSTSSELSEEDQKRGGILPGLVRISMGFTGSLEQRWEQFENALQEMTVA